MTTVAWISASALLATHGCFAAASCLPKTSAEAINAIGHGEIARLVRCGLDPNQALMLDGMPITPLAFAASLGKPQIVREVIQAGADPNYPGPGGMPLPPLEIALSTNNYAAAKVLLKKGAHGDYALQGTGITALMSLAINRGTEREEADDMVHTLIEHGAKLNAQDAKGNTALHWAARTGNGAVLRSLLRSGADRCVRNAKDLYPRDVVKVPDEQGLSADLSQPCRNESTATQ
ncbi:ankyrin repeat domain-containing protein [Ralstonia solanacearum]|uniref:ankyrin repeat domain-containing protein n=1 Tax=Ralstonia solanacearum TaxID=305 RepID=UPI0009BFBB4A|nr:ankyrin repeat domain-containing protein [Ralstonia solanacearum]